MAVTNLGGGGVLETTTNAQNNMTGALQGLAQQNMQNNANQALQDTQNADDAIAEQKAVQDDVWGDAMEEFSAPYLAKGLSMGYIMEQNPDLFREALTGIMGDADAANEYMTNTIGQKETAEQQAVRFLESSFNADVENVGLMDRMKEVPEDQRQGILDQEVSRRIDVGFKTYADKVQGGMNVRDVAADAAGMSYEEFEKTPAYDTDFQFRKQLYNRFDLGGDYRGTKEQNTAMTDAIDSGLLPVKKEVVEHDSLVSEAVETAFTSGPKHQMIAMSAFGDPTLYTGNPTDVNKVEKDLPDNDRERAGMYLEYMNQIGVGTGTQAETSAKYAKIPLEERNKIKYLAQKFEDWSNEDLLKVAGPVMETKYEDINVNSLTMSYEVPADTPPSVAKATKYMLDEKGALSKYSDLSAKMVEQGKRAVVPLLYESLLKETMDDLGIKESEAKTALEYAQTQKIYEEIGQGRLPSGEALTYTPIQRTQINSYMDNMAKTNIGYTFDAYGDIKGVNQPKKNAYNKDEWDNLGSTLTQFATFAQTDGGINYVQIGEIKIENGQFKNQTLPVYMPSGSKLGGGSGQTSPTVAKDVDDAIK